MVRTPADRDRERAATFFNSLEPGDRLLLGDCLIIEGFDWREWGLQSKPSSVFMNHLDRLRIQWDQTQC